MNELNDTNPKIRLFTDLKVWQEGHKLVLEIYKATEKFPSKETYSLIDQMRRAFSSTFILSFVLNNFYLQEIKR